MSHGPGSRHRRLLATATGVLAVLVAAHWQVASEGLGYAGLVLAVDHLYNVALTVALLIACWACGQGVLRWMGPAGLDAPDRMVVAVVLGAAALALALAAAGLAGLLAPPVMLAIPMGAAWLGREELPRIRDRVVRAFELVPATVWIVGGLVVTALLSRGLAPPTDWDSLMYHLHLPQEFLEAGEIFRPQDTLHVAFAGLVHMLYLPLLALGGSSAPALLSLAFGLLLPFAVYRLARRIADPISAEVAGVAIWGTTAVALVAVTARVDVTLLLFLTVAHALLYDALAGDGDRRHLLLAAVLLGCAIGVKYQAGAYILALSPLIAWAAFKGGLSRGRLRWRGLALFAGVAGIVALPWFAKNWLLLDAPFYPFLAERLLPTWLAELHGSRVVPEAVDTAVFDALREIRRPFGLVEAFFHPERLSPEGEAAHYHLSPLLLLLPAWLFWFRDWKLGWVMLPGLGYVALVLAVSPRTNLRYLLPAIPSLTVVASVLAVRIARSVLDRFGVPAGEDGPEDPDLGSASGRWSRVRLAAVGLAMASLVPTGISLYQWLSGEVSLAHLAGAQSRSEYLSQRRNPALVTQAGLTDFGERPPPDDARVLMMFEARELYFDVPALQDPLLTNWSLLAPIRGELDCLRDTDITHVLVGTGVLGYYFDRGLDPGTVRWPEFRAFAGRCLEQELEVPGYALFRVPGADGEKSGAGRP